MKRHVTRVALLGLFLCCSGSSALLAQARRLAQVAFGENVRLSDAEAEGHDESEPAIAVSPVDPLNVVTAFHNPGPGGSPCRNAYSLDGGETWSLGGDLPQLKQNNTCSDPSVAADLAGRFYAAYLDYPRNSLTADVVVAASADGGRTFPSLSITFDGSDAQNPDKPYMAVDARATSPFQGNLYLSWTNAFTDQIHVQASSDGGLTWSQPVQVSNHPEGGFLTDQGSLPVIAPDGTAYVLYAEFDFFVGPLSILYVSSADGGRTWSAPAAVATGLPSPGFFRLRGSDPLFGAPGNLSGFRGLTYPTAAITPNGTIYVAWVDFPEGSCVVGSSPPPCTNADVRMSVSRDGGRRWSAPVKVTDETNPTDQFMPWIAAHPDGLVSIIWNDRRLDASNVLIDAFYTNTGDGKIFLPNRRISSESSRPPGAFFFGDYNNLAVSSDRIFPVWNDIRSAEDTDIFTARGLRLRSR